MNARIGVRSSSLWIAALLSGLMACDGKRQPSGGEAAGSVPKKAPSVSAIRVETAVVTANERTVRMERPGQVHGARDAHLSAPLGGYVEAVPIKSSDRVKKNQVIARVDTRMYDAQVKLTAVELKAAQRELARVKRMRRAVARARLDAARTRLARSKAQHQLSLTRRDRAVIRAPFAGTVVELDIEPGEVAPPGAPIARLIQLSPAHVFVSVTDRDVGALERGATVRVFAAGAAEPMAGVIHSIESAANLNTRTFLVKVEVRNAKHTLLPGMMARVEFRTKRRGNALLIPQDFLVTRLNGNGVFVVSDDSVAEWRPVTLGRIIGTQVEVGSGIALGDRVVCLGQRSLSSGDRLIVTREGTCCRDGRVVASQTTALGREQSASAIKNEEKVK